MFCSPTQTHQHLKQSQSLPSQISQDPQQGLAPVGLVQVWLV